MKRMVCEVCGSTELRKENGSFVCKACGMEYAPEDAHALVREVGEAAPAATAPVAPAATADDKEYERLIREAKVNVAEMNQTAAEPLLNKAVSLCPDRYEAWALKAEFPKNRFYDKQLHIIEEVVRLTPAAKRTEVQDTIMRKWCDFLFSNGNLTTNVTSGEDHAYVAKIYMLLQDLSPECAYEVGAALVNFPQYKRNRNELFCCDDELIPQIQARRDAAWENTSPAFKEKERREAAELEALAEELEKEDKTAKGGCYVATAVYGSYDCPQVWTLRRYRDNVLAETWYGRCFIKLYYAVSPTLVKWFGHTQWFKKLWRGKLDSLVKKLQDGGMESTPYADKQW